MIDIEVYKAKDLTESDFLSLETIQKNCPRYRSPFLHPRFFQCVSTVHPNSEIAIISTSNKAVGYFFYERLGKHTAIPCGRQMSDYQAVVCDESIKLNRGSLLRKCRLQRFNFDHLLQDETSQFSGVRAVDLSPITDLSKGFTHYLQSLQDGKSTLSTDYRRKYRKLQDDYTTPTLNFLDSSNHLEELFTWKSEQYQATSVEDLFKYPWARELLTEISQQTSQSFRGTVTTLSVQSDLAAIVFGIISNGVWHWWIPTHNKRFSRYSPGLLLVYGLTENCTQFGIKEIDFGKGESTFKERFANTSVRLYAGSHVRPLMKARLWISRNLRKISRIVPPAFAPSNPKQHISEDDRSA